VHGIRQTFICQIYSNLIARAIRNVNGVMRNANIIYEINKNIVRITYYALHITIRKCRDYDGLARKSLLEFLFSYAGHGWAAVGAGEGILGGIQVFDELIHLWCS
jgi:hypothetical protein